MSKKVSVVVGSLRNNGFNKQFADYVAAGLEAKGVEVSFLDYSKVPFVNQDIEYPAPAEVAAVREELSKVDGVWFVSPEYNGYTSGALKNLVDWLSRPLVEFDFEGPRTLSGKPVAVSGVAGKSAAAGARAELAAILGFVSPVVGGQGTGIVLQPEAFTTGKVELTADQKEVTDAHIAEFVAAL